RRNHPLGDLAAGNGGARLPLRNADVPDHARALRSRHRTVHVCRHGRRPRPRHRLHRDARALRSRSGNGSHRADRRDRRRRRGASRALRRRPRLQAGRRLHRRLHRAAGEADGPRGRHHHRVRGNGRVEGGGARGGRRPRGKDSHRGRRDGGGGSVVICPNCGTENKPEARFCVSCGRDLSDATAPIEATGGATEPGAPTPPRGAPMPAPGAPTEVVAPVAVPAAAAPPPRSTLSLGWPTAIGRAALAFAVMVVLGQAIAFGAYAAAGRTIVFKTVARIGGLYFELFHRVGIEARASNLGGSALGGATGAVGGLSFTISVGLLLATLLAVVLLFRAGRAVADRAGGPMLARVVHGMKPSIFYGLLAFAFSFLIRFHIAVPPGTVALSGQINVEPSHLAAFLYPFLIALVAGAAGGLRSASLAGESTEAWGRRTVGVWGGGVRMLALGLVLSFVGLLVLAALDPTTTADYFRGAFGGGAARGTVLVGHHVLLAPNQSMWVLIPAMGGSVNLSIAGTNVELLSYSHFPQHFSLTGGATSGFGTPTPQVQGGTAPAGYFLFLLVPLLSVLIGGRAAAARGGARARPEAAMLGAL